MNKEQAVHSFFSSFKIPAYEENSVPENATFPRLTYEVITDSFRSVVGVSASLWYRDSSWSKITEKLHQIERRINSGYFVKYDDGAILIQKGSPFAQNLADESDKNIKRKLMNFNFEYISEN